MKFRVDAMTVRTGDAAADGEGSGDALIGVLDAEAEREIDTDIEADRVEVKERVDERDIVDEADRDAGRVADGGRRDLDGDADSLGDGVLLAGFEVLAVLERVGVEVTARTMADGLRVLVAEGGRDFVGVTVTAVAMLHKRASSSTRDPVEEGRICE
jgi:hypothetical protein